MLTPNDSRSNPRERLLDAFNRRGGVLTRRDIAGLGFGSNTLKQLLQAGSIVRAAHGLYRLTEVAPFGNAALAQACLAIPSGVIALQSALSYFELTTQIISEVAIAVPRHIPRKRVEITLRIVLMPLSRFTSDIKRVLSEEGDRFRIFTAERTVCDCFAYPDIVPENVAYEGLRTYLEGPSAKISSLMQQAALTKTEHIIGPVVRARIA
ncbi:MAG TPA: type IV toxin-antitoxin system AbiEi family antitoxin domain-containing protein [Candidatus Baltobacteraceae bacterium]|jgi:predicted transcriptional regulator of viral defense system|nr:type IV toxin-antitoxin system AbiEi family antitoxin domain-containing protein [Candidatus Baltobacteraceae bacterium]